MRERIAEIVAGHVEHNTIGTHQLPELIATVNSDSATAIGLGRRGGRRRAAN